MAYKYYLIRKDELESIANSYWGSYGGPPCGITDYGDFLVCTVNLSTPNKAALFEDLSSEFSSEDHEELRAYMAENNLITID